MECIISVLPVGHPGFPVDKVLPVPNAHRILNCLDNDPVEPIRIHWLIDLPVPTLVHCNVGQNRSSMVSSCWLVLHKKMDAESALRTVSAKRTATLGHEPRISEVMRQNVHTYATWLESDDRVDVHS
jgi:hypothetical protein